MLLILPPFRGVLGFVMQALWHNRIALILGAVGYRLAGLEMAKGRAQFQNMLTVPRNLG